MRYNKSHIRPSLLYTAVLVLLAITGCRKVEYNTIDSPAYLRVFNSLNYDITLVNKDQPPPYLTMIIDPVFDPAGLITGGAIIGDFLDKRLIYAPPYPSSAGNTSVNNNEYPGKEKVLAAPVVNGFDLSSWAQIPSGKHRFVFFSRPYNTIPFLQLPASSRKTLLADSTLTLQQGEVYTMEIIQPDINSTQTALYIRNEQFHKRAFADSLLYVNFYNLSAAGYATAHAGDDANVSGRSRHIKDTMNVYYSLMKPDSIGMMPGRDIIPGYTNVYLSTLRRSLQPAIAPYYSIPVFAAKDSTGSIRSYQWELFTFLDPAIQVPDNPYPYYPNQGNWSTLSCTDYYYAPSNSASENEGLVPNLIINTASGKYTSRSFSTVSTVEFINNRIYVMSVQRVYEPPAGN